MSIRTPGQLYAEPVVNKPRQTRSLAQRLAAERGNYFVGRTTERDAFRSLLGAGDPSRSGAIHSFFGPGGMGKSTLLAKVRQDAREAGCVTTWAEVGSATTPLEVLEQWMTNIEPELEFSDFRKARAQYLELENRASGLRAALAKGAESSLSATGPLGSFVTGALGEDRVRQKLNSLLGVDEADAILSANRWLAKGFLDDINRVDQRPVLVLDRYEAATPSLDRWVREALLSSPSFDDRTLLLVGGRRPLESMDAAWSEWTPVSTSTELRPFTDVEVAEYFALRGTTHSAAQLAEVHRITRGVPWAVALAFDSLSTSDGSFSDSEGATLQERLIPRFLSHLDLEGPTLRETLEVAALLQVFTEDLVARVLERSVSKDLQRLAEYTFIRIGSRGYSLDEPIAEFIADRLRTTAPGRYRSAYMSAASHFAAEMERVTPLSSPWRALLRSKISALGKVDTSLVVQELEQFSASMTGIVVADDLDEVVDSALATAWSESPSAELLCLAGLSHLAMGRLDEGYEQLTAVLIRGDKALDPKAHLRALSGLVDACHRRGNVSDALGWCLKGIELAEREASPDATSVFLARLAETLGVLGREAESQDAVNRCTDSLSRVSDPRLRAEIRIVLSYVYAFQAKCAEARESADHAVSEWPAEERSYVAALADNLAAWTYSIDGQYEAGLRRARQSLRYFRDRGDQYHRGLSIVGVADVLRTTRDFKGSLAWNRRADRVFTAIQGAAYKLTIAAQTSRSLLESGRPEAVLDTLSFLHDPGSYHQDDRYNLGLCLATLGTAQLQLGEDVSGRETLMQGVEILSGAQSSYGRVLAAQLRCRWMVDGAPTEVFDSAHAAGWYDLAAQAAFDTAANLAASGAPAEIRIQWLQSALMAAQRYNVFKLNSTFDDALDLDCGVMSEVVRNWSTSEFARGETAALRESAQLAEPLARVRGLTSIMTRIPSE